MGVPPGSWCGESHGLVVCRSAAMVSSASTARSGGQPWWVMAVSRAARTRRRLQGVMLRASLRRCSWSWPMRAQRSVIPQALSNWASALSDPVGSLVSSPSAGAVEGLGWVMSR